MFRMSYAEKDNTFIPRKGGGFHHQYRCKKGLEQPSTEVGVENAETSLGVRAETL